MIRSSALLLVCLIPHRSVAQSTTSLLPNATVLDSRTSRIRMLVSWTRWDALLGDSIYNIAAPMRTAALDPRQIPSFAPIEADIRSVSGISSFQLSAGNVIAATNSRIVTAPLILEYGLTSRLTLGLVVPLIETRSTVQAQLNPFNGVANVGPNPALISGGPAQGQNAAFVRSVREARTSLSGKLSQCQSTPTGSGCSTLLAQQTAVQALLQRSDAFAATLERLYGTSATSPGLSYVPIQESVPQRAITGQIAALASQYKDFLGTDAISGGVVGAAGPGAQQQFQTLLRNAGLDTLRSTDRAGIGDISLGATLQLVNTFPDSGVPANNFRYRVSANGTIRIGTGQPANRNRLFDLGTSYGQNGIDVGVATDVQIRRRVSATAVATYAVQLGSIDVNRVPATNNAFYPLTLSYPGTYSAGNVLWLSVIPRYRLAGYFGINGEYSMLYTGADKYTIATGSATSTPLEPFPAAPYGFGSTTAQRVGFGFSYSTLANGNRGPGALPFEVLYSHLETIAASGAPANKTFRDQIELRVYW